jgi:hypothetical protein
MFEGIELPISSTPFWILLIVVIAVCVLLSIIKNLIPIFLRGFVGSVTALLVVGGFFYFMFYLDGYKLFN